MWLKRKAIVQPGEQACALCAHYIPGIADPFQRCAVVDQIVKSPDYIREKYLMHVANPYSPNDCAFFTREPDPIAAGVSEYLYKEHKKSYGSNRTWLKISEDRLKKYIEDHLERIQHLEDLINSKELPEDHIHSYQRTIDNLKEQVARARSEKSTTEVK